MTAKYVDNAFVFFVCKCLQYNEAFDMFYGLLTHRKQYISSIIQQYILTFAHYV